MFWTVYKTTNSINGRFYVGVHATENPNDGYYGSGKIIKAILKRFGPDKLKKEVIFCYKTEDEAYQKEREIVAQFLGNPLCMNLCEGGGKPPSHKGKKLSPSEIEARRIRAFGNKYALGKKIVGRKMPPRSESHRLASSKALKGRKPSPQTIKASRERDFSFMQTPEYKAKMRAVKIGVKQSKEWVEKRTASRLARLSIGAAQ